LSRRLKLKYNEPTSNFTFGFNMRRYYTALRFRHIQYKNASGGTITAMGTSPTATEYIPMYFVEPKEVMGAGKHKSPPSPQPRPP
jgi:hypothetical protein